MAKYYNKVAIIGCGAVGASIAYALSIQGTVSEMVLIDVNKDKAEGEVMDINHGMLNFSPMNIYCGDYPDTGDCDVIIVASGVGRKPGESRLDLARNNVRIAKSVAENIKPYYNGAVIVVVANPVDILTYTMSQVLDIPQNKIFGTGTTLDSARFKFFLSEALEINVSNIHGYVIGEHGDTQFPVVSSISIAGLSLEDYCKANNMTVDLDEIVERVKNAGGEVIKRKGATYYAIASSVCRIVDSVIKNEFTILPVSTTLCDAYGLSGLSIGVPCILNAEGVYKTIPLRLSGKEEELLQKSAGALKKIIDAVL